MDGQAKDGKGADADGPTHGPDGLILLREVKTDYEEILRRASAGESARAARQRRNRWEQRPEPVLQQRQAAIVEPSMGDKNVGSASQQPGLPALDEAAVKRNAELSKHPCLKKMEKSILSTEQKGQALGFFSVFRDIITVEKKTGIPRHFVKHYLNEHERVETVKKAVKILQADGDVTQASKGSWHSTSAIKSWMRQEGYGHLLVRRRADSNSKAKALR